VERPAPEAENPAAPPALSIVIPLFNESETIPALYAELTRALSALPEHAELIFVDDGSTDASFHLLTQLHARDSRIKVIRLRRNYGQTPALSAGFDATSGEWVVTLDADLQNDPADIPILLAKAREGYDIVSGWRKDRQDAVLSRKIPSRIANWLIGAVTGVRIHDYGCSLKIYRGEIARSLRLYGELHRFLPATASSLGIRVGELPVRHRARERGQSKYGGWINTFTRTIKVLLDLLSVRFLLSYSTRPIHVFGSLGLLSSALGGAIGLYLSYRKLFLGESLSGRPLLTLAVVLVIVGVQFLSIGLLSDLVVRTYHETQGKPIYSVRETVPPAPR
jgi:glycosyltransferase involved in cell wall biosynthesis